MQTLTGHAGRGSSPAGTTTNTNTSGATGTRRRGTFDRPRLLDLLGRFRASERRLMTLWASAGAGKTTLLRQWTAAMEQRGVPVRWLDADELAGGAVPDGGAPPTAPEAESWLVIDDLDRMVDGRGLAPLVRVLGALSDGTRVLIAGRYEPSGFSAVGEVLGGRAVLLTADLAFTVEETIELALAFDLTLAVHEAEALAERTAGWAAGLALAMPFIASQADPVTAIEQFDGDQHQVADYLLVRVLDALDTHDRDVLMRTAIGSHVPLDLAVTLTRRRDVGAVLARLSARNVLVEVAPDGDGFRFHPILASYMRAEFRRRDEHAAIQNHATAAEWYQSQGAHDAALEQALLSRDRDVIARQVEHSGIVLLMQGRSAVVSTALRALVSVPATLPLAVVRLGMDLPSFPDRLGAEEQLAEMQRLLMAAPPVQARRYRPIVFALAAFMVTDPAEAVVRLRALGEYLRNTPIESLDAALAVRSAIAWCLVTAGLVADADPLLRSLQATALRAGYTWVYLIASDVLASIAARAGDWRAASLHEERMAAACFDTTPPYNRATARAMLITTAYAYERCEPVSLASIHQIRAADPSGSDLGLLFHARALLLTASMDASAAPREALSQVVQLVRADGRDHPRIVAAMATRLVSWSSALHGAPAAVEVRHVLTEILGPQSLEALMLRLMVGRSDYLAERAVADALGRDRSAWTGTSIVNANLALALHAHDAGRQAETVDRVGRALAVSEEFGYAREFLACRGRGAHLVFEMRGSLGPHEAYAEHVLDLAGLARVPFGLEESETTVPLTPREQELLAELPAYQTVADIAAKHHLSVNTIKTHLRSIYAKLGVSGRTDAVAVARRRGML